MLGRVCLRARTYTPDTGRFLRQDSYLGVSSQPCSRHRYAYAFDTPLTYSYPEKSFPPSTTRVGNGQGVS